MKMIFSLQNVYIVQKIESDQKRPYHTLSKLAHDTYTLFYTKISIQVQE